MTVLDEYTIPFHGLPQGEHTYTFRISGAFFEAIGTNLFSDADLELEVTMHMGSSLLTFDMALSGTLQVECDRCTAYLPYPLEGSTKAFFLVSTNSAENEGVDSDDREIVHLPPGISNINIAQQVLEFINSLVPGVVIPCEATGDTSNCNTTVLDKLSSAKRHSEPEPEPDPRWQALQNLKQKKK